MVTGKVAILPLLLTATTAGPEPASYGICTFNWPAAVEYKGAEIPFTVAETPASVNGSGKYCAACVDGESCVPAISAIVPGARPADADAAFATDVIFRSVDAPTMNVTATVIACGIALTAWIVTTAE